MELADVIVCPGKFVADSIPAWAKQKPVIVSPFGSPEISSSFFKRKEKRANQPLRVLFVGSMGQRKGLGDLFAAMKLIKTNSVELVVMGSLLETMSFYRDQLPQFIYEPGRPHSGVLELMRNCDVLCLPSVVEGRALVMQEAMSQGLPLIITPNTGGEDLIIEGKTGFLVPIRSPEAIAEKIDCLLITDQNWKPWERLPGNMPLSIAGSNTGNILLTNYVFFYPIKTFVWIISLHTGSL